MTYSHSLLQVKFSLLLQRMFGNNNPFYDADHIRETDGLNNNYSTTPESDVLSLVQKNPFNADSYSFDMGTGNFLEVVGERNYNMRIEGMENYSGIHSDADMSITGTKYANNIQTGTGDDYIQGMGGDDTIHGKGGDDVLSGGIGRDYIDGGLNNDLLIGGEGLDMLRGGEGVDTFRLSTGSGWDRIMDFQDGIDRIEVRAIDGIDDINMRSKNGTTIIKNHTEIIAIVYNTDPADLTLQGEVLV